MIRTTLAQMRRSLGRLAAAGVAIAIGTGFLTATFLASAVLQRSTHDALTAQYASADLVVERSDGQGWTLEEAARASARAAAVPGVSASAVDVSRDVTVRAAGTAGARSSSLRMIATAPDDRLVTYGVARGRAPATAAEIALPDAVAQRLGVAVGDQVTTVDGTVDSRPAAADAADVAPGDRGAVADLDAPVVWTVVGIDDDPSGAYLSEGTPALVTPDGLGRFSPVTSTLAHGVLSAVPQPEGYAMLVALAPGTDLGTASAALEAAHPGWSVVTRDAAAAAAVSAAASGQDVFLYFILGFAGLALVVASLVIANTFQVIVAQRRRTLALLRCTGASGAQLRRSVLLEATILGVVGSLVGVLLGAALVQGALLVARGLDLGVPLPRLVDPSPLAVLVPLVVGTLVTVLACVVPAREATRVAPLEALRPAEPVEARSHRGRVRLVVACLLTVIGAGLLGLGLVVATSSVSVGLAAGVLGGALSFVGVSVAAVFWLPPLARRAGTLLARTGPTARLATANAGRNPRRTAATSTALMIGVTLVTMMSVGAASARSSLAGALDDHYPVDAVAELSDASLTGSADAAAALVADVRGVASAVPVLETSTVVDASGAQRDLEVSGIAPRDAAEVTRDPEAVAALADGTLVLGKQAAHDSRLVAGDVVRLGGAHGPAVTVTVSDLTGSLGLVTASTMARVPRGDLGAAAIWTAFAPGAAPGDVVDAIDDALATTPHWTTAPAVERAFVERVVDTVLGVVVGLLAVAVVIALIGVANTLALSVLERRRESATLRAVGLSTRQLRRMLGTEGMFIAGAGGVAGIGLGLVYGWAGSWVVLHAVGDVTLAVPWRDLVVILAVSLAAGLLASVAPARSATRTSPVEALAVE